MLTQSERATAPSDGAASHSPLPWSALDPEHTVNGPLQHVRDANGELIAVDLSPCDAALAIRACNAFYVMRDACTVAERAFRVPAGTNTGLELAALELLRAAIRKTEGTHS